MGRKFILFDQDPNISLNIAEKYIVADKYEDALKWLFDAQKKLPDKRVLRLIAQNYFFLELYELSNKYWIKYIDYSPESDWGEAYEAMGINYYYMDNFFLASYFFNKKIEKDGVLRREELNEEIIDYLSNNIDKKSLYKVAYPVEEADYSDELKTGRIYLSNGDFSKAIECFDRIPKGAKEYYEALDDKSMALLIAGYEDKAIALNNRIIKENGESVSAYCNLSSIYHIRGDFEKSRYYYDKAVSIPIIRNEDIYKLATCSLEAGEHQKAIGYLEKLIKEKQYESSLNFLLGIAYINAGNYEGAKRVFYSLMTLFVDNPIYQYYYELSEKLVDKKQSAFALLPLGYNEALPRKESENIRNRIRKYITLEFSTIKRKLNTKQFKFDISWAFRCGDVESAKIMGFLLSSIHSEKSNAMVRDILTDSFVSDSNKSALLFTWIVSGEKGYIGVSCGSFYNRIKLRHLAIEEDDDAQDLFFAYALLLTKLAFIEIKDYDKVSIALNKVYKKLKGKRLSTYTREDMSALILFLCEYERFKSKSEVANFVGVKQNRLDRILDLYNGDKND